LEAMFRAKNPRPDRHLAAAFTRYMHDRNLHWMGCTERRIDYLIADDVVREWSLENTF